MSGDCRYLGHRCASLATVTFATAASIRRINRGLRRRADEMEVGLRAATDHPGEAVPRPDGGIAVSVEELGPIIRRMARLARSLPTAPLDTFVTQTLALPKTTEAERLVVQRVGQDVFRAALLDFWNARCPLTGIAHPRLLRASHMKPWADCDTDAERLDVHNGLLLAAHLDAAFDAGLISFEMDGSLAVSPALADEDIDRLGLLVLPLLQVCDPVMRHT